MGGQEGGPEPGWTVSRDGGTGEGGPEPGWTLNRDGGTGGGTGTRMDCKQRWGRRPEQERISFWSPEEVLMVTFLIQQ